MPQHWRRRLLTCHAWRLALTGQQVRVLRAMQAVCARASAASAPPYHGHCRGCKSVLNNLMFSYTARLRWKASTHKFLRILMCSAREANLPHLSATLSWIDARGLPCHEPLRGRIETVQYINAVTGES